MWRLFFVICSCWLALPALTQAQALRWDRTFSGTAHTQIYAGHATADGGYVVAGGTRGGRNTDVSDSIRGGNDAWIVKYNAQGQKQWDHRYGGEISDAASHIIQTADGGYLVGTSTISGQGLDKSEPSRGLYDFWVLRLDAQGRKLWDHRFGGEDNEYLTGLCQIPDGGFLLAGVSDSETIAGDKSQAGRGGRDGWIVKLDGQGNKLWDRTLGGDSGDELLGAIVTQDGGFLLAGSTFSEQSGDVSEPPIGPSGAEDLWVIKLDATGTMQWNHRYGGVEDDAAGAVVQNVDGTYYVSGMSLSGTSGSHSQPARGGTDVWLLRLSGQGGILWDRRFGTSGDDYSYSGILTAPGGGCVMLVSTDGGADGDKTEPGRGVVDYWVLQVDANGTKAWDRTYGANSQDSPQDLVRLAGGGLLAVGVSFSNQSGDRSQPLPTGTFGGGWLVELDTLGNKLGDQLLTSASDERQRQVVRTRDGGVLAAGHTISEQGLDRQSSPSYIPQIWLMKRDSLGGALWEVALGTDRAEYLRTVQEQANQTLLVAGTARLANHGTGLRDDAAFLAYRLNRFGVEQWRREVDAPGEDWLAEGVQAADGGIVLGGTSRSGIGGDKTEASRGGADFWLVKLNTAQVKLWDHRFGGAGLDSLVSVRQTPDGGYLLAGSTTSTVGGDVTAPGRGKADYWLVKVNSLGLLQWQGRYGGPDNDWLASARPTADGGCLLLGTTFSGIGGDVTEASRGTRDLWMVKVNSTGVLQWQRRFGGAGNEYAASLELDPDGGYIIGASTTSPVSGEVSLPSRGGTDYWLLRLSAGGTKLWDQRLGGSGEDVLAQVVPTRGYGYAVGGTSNSPTGSGEHQQPNKGGYDYWTLLLGARRVAPPVISSFTPGLGLPGTVVTITGTGFTGTSDVAFNGTLAPGFTINSPTSITVTVPAGASTGPITVVANGTGSSATSFVVPTDLLISAAQNVQGIYNNVTVTGPTTGGAGTGTLSGPLTVLGTLTVQDGGALLTACQPLTGTGSFVLQAGATLGICDPVGLSLADATGAVQLTSTRSFSADANYAYNGTQPQVTGTGLPAQVRTLTVQNGAGLTLTQALAVAQVLRLTNGNLTTSGRGLTLLSSAAGTALVDNTGGVVNGTATVQRFVSPARNAGPGYRHFSAPISTATVASLTTPGFTPTVNVAYNSSATPGRVTPFPTVYGYDQSRLATSPATSFSFFDRGWTSPTQLSDPLAVGRGYTVRMPASQTVQFTGSLNNGLITQPLGRAPAPARETGWHLLGNPYPSPLDWTLLVKPATVDDALYVFESSGPYAGAYRACVNGLGGSPLIGAGMGFFVRVNTAGSTPTLAFTNAARLTTFGSEPALGRGPTDTRPLVQLALQDAGGTLPADALYVYFEAGATPGQDARYDAVKLASPSGLGLATLAGAQELAIDGRPMLGAQPLTIPLALALPRPGAYAFAAEELARFAPGTMVYLLDAETGTRQLLAAGRRYPFTAATAATSGRFALQFRPGVVTATGSAVLAAQVHLFPNPNLGLFTLQLPAGYAAQRVWLTNALGQTVLKALLPAGQHASPLVDARGLAPGIYQVHILLPGAHLIRRVVLHH